MATAASKPAVRRARAFLGFVYEPRIGDRDGDGIRDNIDQCPDEPEDLDGFQDEDGCPELTTTTTAFPTAATSAPMCPAPGTTKAVRRTRIVTATAFPTAKTSVPTIPKTATAGKMTTAARNSTTTATAFPITWTRPNEAETVNGIDDKDGCPDGEDTDKDGIPDSQDKCPYEPKTKTVSRTATAARNSTTTKTAFPTRTTSVQTSRRPTTALTTPTAAPTKAAS